MSFSYLGIVFTSGGSFSLARQAQKAILKLYCYLIKFTDVTPKHTLDLFDKLVSPILKYAAEVWGFLKLHNTNRKGAFTDLQETIGGKTDNTK